MDAGGHLECQQRIRDECAQQTGIAQRPPLAGEACHHQRPLVVAGSDVYRDVFAGEADAEAIVQSHGHERRNVEALVAVLPDSLVVPVADRDQVAVALPKGVVDFVEDRDEVALPAMAEIDAERIESVQPSIDPGGSIGSRTWTSSAIAFQNGV